MNRELIRTTSFLRAARKYLKKPPDKAEELEFVFSLLTNDTFDSRLRTHKLKGEFDGVWACSVGYDMRILFEFVTHGDTEAILLLTMGSHDEVY